ncbi:MAG: DivIVA domain-containing protein [Bowdeniella nasicola]|nr:DivIVA domain-containing protein [Bowdeniella nasicola]
MFTREGRLKEGYDPDQVEDFFDRAREAYESDAGHREMTDRDVRSVAFDQVRGGYRFAEVDAALDRLEAAFIKRRRADFIAANGQDAWMEHVAEQATSLYPRLQRPDGEKFADAKKRGYAKTEVDELMNNLVSYFDDGYELSAYQIREVTFASARGAKAYAEDVVDVYLDRVVEVLSAVE